MDLMDQSSSFSRARVAIELATGRSLLDSRTTDLNIGTSITLGTHRRTGRSPHHRELADVCERVGERSLDELLNGVVRERRARDRMIQRGESGEETLDFVIPLVAPVRLPYVFVASERERPVHEIAHVSDDLHRASRCRGVGVVAKIPRRLAQHFRSAIGQCGDEVSKEVRHGFGGAGFPGRNCRTRMTRKRTGDHRHCNGWSLAALALCATCGPAPDTRLDTTTAQPVVTARWRVDTLSNAPARFRPAGWSSENVLWGLVRGRVTRFDTRTAETRTMPSTGWALQTAPNVAVWHNEQGLWVQREGDSLRRIVGPDGKDSTRRGDGPHVLLSPDGLRAMLGWQEEWDTDYDILVADGSRRKIVTRIAGYYLNSAALWLDSTHVLFQTVATGPRGGQPEYRESGWRGDLAVLDLSRGTYERVTSVSDLAHLRVAGWFGDKVLATEWDSTGVKAHWLYDTRAWQRQPIPLPRGRAFGSRAGAAVVLLDVEGDSTDAVLIARDTMPLGRVARDAEPYFTPSGRRGVIHTARGVLVFAATP